MFARHPEAAGVERAINSYGSLVRCSNSVEVRRPILTMTHRLSDSDIGVMLNTVASHDQERISASETPKPAAAAITFAHPTVTIEVTEQKGD
jgi:hypothetical protein